MSTGERNSVELKPGARLALAEAVRRDLPDFAPRLDTVSTEIIVQPFFKKTPILDVTSAVPTPRRIYVAWPKPEELSVLTAHIESFNKVALADRPEGLDDPKLAREYMTYADAWTTGHSGRELALSSLDDIPWWEFLEDEHKVQIEDVKTSFGDKMKAPEMILAFPNYELRQWLLIGQTLVERVLTISMRGEFARTDTVHRRGLPVPPGRIWGKVNGRFVPVG